jgi:hypothetical protein
MTTGTIRTTGVLTATGGVVWGAAWIVAPSDNTENNYVEIWASGVFQVGLFALLAAMWVTAATGTGRVARSILTAEVVAVVLAFAWTLPHLFNANPPTSAVLFVLDVFWPLSMAGFIVIAALVAWARRWPAPLRHIPLVASLLIPVDVAVSWAPDPVRNAVMGTFLAVTYGATGLALVLHAPRVAPMDATGSRPGPAADDARLRSP